MKKYLSRKTALFLSVVMLASCLTPIGIAGNKTVSSAKAKKMEVTQEYTCALQYSKPKAGAKYSCSISNKKILAYKGGSVGREEINKKKSMYIALYVRALKKGTATVKIKETYKKKTKTVQTYTVKVKEPEKVVSTPYHGFSKVYLPYREVEESIPGGGEGTVTINQHYLKLEKGSSVNLNNFSYGLDNTNSKIENTNIASVANGVLTAKNVGETIMTSVESMGEDKIAIIVTEPTTETNVVKVKELCKKINALNTKKYTTKNVIKEYNNLVSYYSELKKYMGDYLDKYYDAKSNYFINYLNCAKWEIIAKMSTVARKKSTVVGKEGVSREGVTIKSVGTKSAKITLKKAVNEYDALLFGSADKPITKKSQISESICIVNKNGYVYYVGAVSVGKKKATLKAYDKVKKGTYYYTTQDKKGNVLCNSIKVK